MVERKRIGELLVWDGLVTQEQVDEALEVQKEKGGSLGKILIDRVWWSSTIRSCSTPRASDLRVADRKARFPSDIPAFQGLLPRSGRMGWSETGQKGRNSRKKSCVYYCWPCDKCCRIEVLVNFQA